jgi:hypothetical protein
MKISRALRAQQFSVAAPHTGVRRGADADPAFLSEVPGYKTDTGGNASG